MNIALLLTPKREVVWLPSEASLTHAIEIMHPHRYTSLPVLDAKGGYVGTLTEGDILWRLLGAGRAWQATLDDVPVKAVPRRTSNHAVRIDADLEALVAQAAQQNFVPVVDDREVFIGIVRRQKVIEYCARRAGIAFSPRLF